jgi:hypothetical protein
LAIQFSIRASLEDHLGRHGLTLCARFNPHPSSTHDDFSVENPRHHSSVSAPFSASTLSIPLETASIWMKVSANCMHGHIVLGRMTKGSVHSLEARHYQQPHTTSVCSLLALGLAGRGERRDASLSGAEYDPDRPLQDLIAGIGSQFGLLGANQAPLRHQVHLSLTFFRSN